MLEGKCWVLPTTPAPTKLHRRHIKPWSHQEPLPDVPCLVDWAGGWTSTSEYRMGGRVKIAASHSSLHVIFLIWTASNCYFLFTVCTHAPSDFTPDPNFALHVNLVVYWLHYIALYIIDGSILTNQVWAGKVAGNINNHGSYNYKNKSKTCMYIITVLTTQDSSR